MNVEKYVHIIYFDKITCQISYWYFLAVNFPRSFDLSSGNGKRLNQERIAHLRVSPDIRPKVYQIKTGSQLMKFLTAESFSWESHVFYLENCYFLLPSLVVSVVSGFGLVLGGSDSVTNKKSDDRKKKKKIREENDARKFFFN